jgi:predicted phosphodiesterase
VWAVGDGASATPRSRAVAAMVRRARPDLLIYLGDVYPHGTRADYERNYDPLYGSLARQTAPTPGNHDQPQLRTGYLGYWHEKLGHDQLLAYVGYAGGWTIASASSEDPDIGHQAAALRAALRGRGNCKLAFWHRSRFSAGPHGDSARVDPLWRAARRRARIVLTGHDHDMQVLRPVDGTQPLVDGAGGGEGLYPVDRSDPRLVWSDDDSAGALRLRLRPGSADYAFVAASGRVLRSGRVRCGTS